MSLTLDRDFVPELNDQTSTEFGDLRDSVEDAVGLCSDTLFVVDVTDLNSQSASLTAGDNL